MFKDKNVVLIVTGGIAAFKAVSLASMLSKEGAKVHTIMTKNAAEFVTPLTFKSITRQKVTIGMFDESDYIPHISLSELADIIVVAPATANIIAKAASGIADDMASTILVSSKAPKVIVPAMNTNMFENSITQDNMDKLKRYGFTVMEPDSGLMACGTSGKGRFPEVERIYGELVRVIEKAPGYYSGKRVLITLGGTMEDIDPVRYITNRSSGKTGFAFAAELVRRGAEVTIVAGNCSELELEHFRKRYGYCRLVPVRAAAEMKEAVEESYRECDILIMAAAVADYKPYYSEEKVKKSDGELAIALERTDDILKGLDKDEHKLHIGFAAETESLLENGKKKLSGKGLDLLVANSVKGEKAAIGGNSSEIFLLNRWDDEVDSFSYAEKGVNIPKILDRIEERAVGKKG